MGNLRTTQVCIQFYLLVLILQPNRICEIKNKQTDKKEKQFYFICVPESWVMSYVSFVCVDHSK